MANINRVVLVGNLTKDPELRHTPSGTAVCKLRLAVNTRQKDPQGNWGDKPNYFDVTVWGNQGESCAQYLSKGRPVGVDGRLDWREWDAQDGTKRQAVEIIADSVTAAAAAVMRATASGSSSRPRQLPATKTSPPPRQTTTSRSDAATRRRRQRPRPAAGPQASGPVLGPDPTQVLLLLQGQGRRDRLQERQPAAQVHLGARKDPVTPDLRGLPAAPASGRGRGEAGARDGVAALRRGQIVEVILRQDIDKVGLRGEVVSVPRGYARNFLFPRRLADEATPARVAEVRKVEDRRAQNEAKTFEDAQAVAERLGKVELRFDVKAGPTGSLFGSVTATDVADELWENHKVRVDRRKIAGDPIKRIGRYQVPIELFQDVTVEVRTLVIPEGGELPPEEELEAMEAAEQAEQSVEAPTAEKPDLDLDALDAAALAQEARLIDAGELQPSKSDVEGELADDEFDRAVDAGSTEEQS